MSGFSGTEYNALIRFAFGARVAVPHPVDRSPESQLARGVLAGLIGGLAGTWAMSHAQRLWTHAIGEDPPESAAGKHDARDWQERSENQNANELAAQAVAQWVLGRHLSRDELRPAAAFSHYAFGAAVGAIYGVYVERRSRQRAPSGAGLGAALWVTADEITMPVLGLSQPTTRRPLEMHLQSFAAHLVYGVITEVIRRPVRRAL
jgi:hypothetical protein